MRPIAQSLDEMKSEFLRQNPHRLQEVERLIDQCRNEATFNLADCYSYVASKLRSKPELDRGSKPRRGRTRGSRSRN